MKRYDADKMTLHKIEFNKYIINALKCTSLGVMQYYFFFFTDVQHVILLQYLVLTMVRKLDGSSEHGAHME